MEKASVGVPGEGRTDAKAGDKSVRGDRDSPGVGEQPAEVRGGPAAVEGGGDAGGHARGGAGCLLALHQNQEAAGYRKQGDHKLRRTDPPGSSALSQAFKTEKLTFATINSRVRELLAPV